ncbi:MAG: carbonic anhydrase family protein, partial [Gammaproteobacteria bacterium]|nr:carbonic anhydrase family protein [Gammaproteobacteria bacterium]
MKTDVMRPLLLGLVLLSITLRVTAVGFDLHEGTIPNWQTAEWSYEGETGPKNWSTLSTAYKDCGAGLQQSPVDISEARYAHLPVLKFSYRTSMVSIHRRPQQLWLEYDTGSTLKLAGKRYRFLGFDFHTPGEHSVRGRR